MRFSQRMGFAPIRTVLQIESIDPGLRNRLWNVVRPRFESSGYDSRSDYLGNDDGVQALFVAIWHDFLKLPTDSLSHSFRDTLRSVRDYFFKCEWHEVYDFVEFLAGSNLALGISSRYQKRGYSYGWEYMTACNEVLKAEMSGYRFVSGIIVQITGEDEVAAIEQALAQPEPLRPVTVQLRQALSLLADRKAPDFRNSIKESISAIESLCKLISGLPKATLGPALKAVEKAANLHPSLNDAFHKLYGYTSDAQGIRHALMDEPALDFEDAKFMLVSCSAFVNYLVVKAQKAGIKF